MPEAVALFGGSFNPIHIGHLIAARAIAEHLDIPRVMIVPAAWPPHKWAQELADAAHRLEMCWLAVAGEPQLEVSDAEFQQGGLNYAVRTVEAFRRELGPSTAIYWVIGEDSLGELPRWQRIGEMLELCRVLTAVRRGFDSNSLLNVPAGLTAGQWAGVREGLVPTPRVDISSSGIRWRIRHGRSVRYLVPDAVREYIARQGLYRARQKRGRGGERGSG